MASASHITKIQKNLSGLVGRSANQEGFEISHIGMLCWTPLPSAGIKPRTKARIQALEGFFADQFLAETEIPKS